MHLVQTRERRTPPLAVTMRTRLRFGSQRRRVLLLAWETLFPVTGPLPQISHTLAMIILLISGAAAPSCGAWDDSIRKGFAGKNQKTTITAFMDTFQHIYQRLPLLRDELL
jgi:hypothetical protein